MAYLPHWRRYWLRAIECLAQSLPNRCLLCHQSLHSGTGLCGHCLGCSLYTCPVCLGCGRGLTGEFGFCGSCRALDALPVVAPASYHTGIGSVIAAIKYQGQFAALGGLCEALYARVQRLSELGLIRPVSLLLPVPLHPQRLRQRGFNQAYEIALMMSALAGVPLNTALLGRSRNTPQQAGLSGKVRRQNLKDAFVIDGICEAGSVALIDDVVTTGSTVNEIARLLEAQGVAVQVWCLARAEAPGLLD